MISGQQTCLYVIITLGQSRYYRPGIGSVDLNLWEYEEICYCPGIGSADLFVILTLGIGQYEEILLPWDWVSSFVCLWSSVWEWVNMKRYYHTWIGGAGLFVCDPHFWNRPIWRDIIALEFGQQTCMWSQSVTIIVFLWPWFGQQTCIYDSHFWEQVYVTAQG